MRHLRLDLATLSIEGVAVPLRAASLQVVGREEHDRLDWECLAYGLDRAPISRGRYLVELVTLDGRTLSGPAVLVRSIEGAHVLRGDGPLIGIDAADLG